jgi:hypothetical protein
MLSATTLDCPSRDITTRQSVPELAIRKLPLRSVGQNPDYAAAFLKNTFRPLQIRVDITQGIPVDFEIEDRVSLTRHTLSRPPT